MATRMQRHHDVLHATDTALRLVNQALGDLGAADPLVSPVTPIPAVGMREGLDRALAAVAELEQEAADSRDAVRHARYAALRETLRDVVAQAR
ncbi:MAG: hypothetical protein K8S21_08905 [Gemmatimonadetes bacterium]|nr:hypothetical protein [Gemmatimonadota bacterium]